MLLRFSEIMIQLKEKFIEDNINVENQKADMGKMAS